MILDVDAIRADFPILSRPVHKSKPLIYFDNAASTQHPRQVISAVSRCYETAYANVHRGVHALSMVASENYEQARQTVARFIGASSTNEVVFNSGTTAGINLVAHAWGSENVTAGDEILLTIMEHHSNIVPWQQLAQRTGAKVRFAPIDENGLLDREQFRQMLNERTKVVGIAGVSNTLGTINPIAQLTEEAHQAGAIVVVDAAQQIPHEPTSVKKWNADFIAFSGHKLLGPSGIGVLWGKESLLEAIPPFLGGGSMIRTVDVNGFTPGELPAKFEAGTPPIAQAAGLAAAIDYVDALGIDKIADHERQLTIEAYDQWRTIDGMRLLGPDPQHRAGIISFAIDGVSALDLSFMLDRHGIAVRAGHHCTMPLHERFGLTASVRASFYVYNTIDEVARMTDALESELPRLR